MKTNKFSHVSPTSATVKKLKQALHNIVDVEMLEDARVAGNTTAGRKRRAAHTSEYGSYGDLRAKAYRNLLELHDIPRVIDIDEKLMRVLDPKFLSDVLQGRQALTNEEMQAYLLALEEKGADLSGFSADNERISATARNHRSSLRR